MTVDEICLGNWHFKSMASLHPSKYLLMKTKSLFTLSFFILTACTAGMGQAPWTTNGNAPSQNCFIGTTNPSPLVMKTNGTERLAIDENGRLSIAGMAAADTAALVVLGDGSLAKATDPGNGGTDCKLLLWDGDGNASSPDCFIGTTNAMPFRIHTKGIERMRVTADGNVVVQGFGAKAPFQVFDHLGVTFNRQDFSATDVVRTIGFNLYQDGAIQRHYQSGTAAKVEFVSSTGLLQLGVAQSQQADGQAGFLPGIQLDQYGRAGIGARPDVTDVLAIGGIAKLSNATNPHKHLRLGHDGSQAFVQGEGGNLALRSLAGAVSVEQTGNAANHLRLGHDGTHGLLETGGGVNARLKVNTQSGKALEVGGDALFSQHIGIGTTSFMDNATGKEYRLAVNGRIRATEVKVYSGWADHVFSPDYKLMSLPDVEAYIAAHGHLPNVPSASEVEQNGADVGATQALLLEKIEELTLHMIRLEKENVALRREIEAIR